MELLFGFEGRIGRLKYWLGGLLQAILLFVVALVVLGLLAFNSFTSDFNMTATGWMAVFAIWLFGVWTHAALVVKRYHDLDKSGWWFLMLLVPFIGPIWVIIECGFFAGTQGVNRYGSPPSSGWGSSVDEEIEAMRSQSQAEQDAGTFSTSIRAARKLRETQGAQPVRSAPAGFGRRGLQT